jgi:hypothetical protein
MAEGRPRAPEELERLRRETMERILDRASSDPEWRQRLLDDPEAAIAEFPETQSVREMQSTPPEGVEPLPAEEEVVGHTGGGPGGPGGPGGGGPQRGCWQCWWSWYWYWDWYSYTWYGDNW